MLKNTAYPSGWPKEGVAQLVDGVYREKYMPDSATEMVISLADMHTFGDLNGDGVDDVVVILISYPGGSGTFFGLAAVLNQDGTTNPVATVFLGDRTIIRSMAIESGQIVLEMITQGPDDPMCCPNMDRRQVYTLQDGNLNLVEQIDTPKRSLLSRVLLSQNGLNFHRASHRPLWRAAFSPSGTRGMCYTDTQARRCP